MYKDKSTTTGLAAAGVIPFAALAIAVALGIETDWARSAFCLYGAVIAAFMAGTIWTQAQVHHVRTMQFLVLSNIAALAAFGSLLIPGRVGVTLVIQMIAFALLLWCDHVLYRQGHQPGWYFVLRRNITIAVEATFVLMLIVA